MRRYRKSKFNKFLTIIALSLTFFVTIGYARLKETLTVSSSAKFSPIPVLKATSSSDKTAFRSDTYKTKIKTRRSSNGRRKKRNSISRRN